MSSLQDITEIRAKHVFQNVVVTIMGIITYRQVVFIVITKFVLVIEIGLIPVPEGKIIYSILILYIIDVKMYNFKLDIIDLNLIEHVLD